MEAVPYARPGPFTGKRMSEWSGLLEAELQVSAPDRTKLEVR